MIMRSIGAARAGLLVIGAAAVAGLATSVAACKKADADGTAPSGSTVTAPNPMAPAGEPTAGAAASPAPGTGPGASVVPAGAPISVAEILKQSLNSTVEKTERFHSAPHYTLTIDLDSELYAYEGTERLDYTNQEKEALTELNFLLYPNSKELCDPGVKNLVVEDVLVDGRPVKADTKAERLRIPLESKLEPGKRVTVTMSFKGVIHRQAEGSSDMQKLALQQVIQMIMGDAGQKGGYGIYSVGDGITSLGLWYPKVAAYDDNGWDSKHDTDLGDVSYFDVSNYDVTVTTSADLQLATTGVELSRAQAGDAQNRRTTRFVAGAVREFTIQASREYESTSAFVDGVKITSWYKKTESKTGKDVLEYGKAALKLYNTEFGPYPYTELDLAEAPLVGGAGGVEFPGLTTIGKMFYASDAAPAGGGAQATMALANSKYVKETLEFVVAHEVAHQWWNAVVGSDSKRHPFVDEAMANATAAFYFERVHGKAVGDAQVEMQLKLPYQLARMVGSKDRPVDLPTDQYNGMMEYAAIVYGKGALFFHTLRQQMGDGAYLGVVKSYYKAHAFGIAKPEDLIDAFAKASPSPDRTVALADRWLKQTHGDEDIGPIKWTALLKTMLGDELLQGPMASVVKLLDDKGAGEIAKLLQRVISPDGEVKEAIDYGAIVKLAAKLMGSEGGDDGGILGKVGDVLSKNPNLIDDVLAGNDKGLVKVLAKQLVGGDPKTDAIIDATDAILKLLGD